MMNYSTRFNLLLGLLVLLNTLPAHAIGKRDITLDRLEQGERLEVSPGYGLTINLMPVGKVNRAWLTDKSWLTIANENGPCPNGGCGQSRFIYLQLIDKLNFNGLPSTVDGATLLNAITPTGEVLQFKLVRDLDGVPAYTSLYVQPKSRKPEPVAFTPQIQPQSISVNQPPVQIREIPVEILINEGEDSNAGELAKISTPKRSKKKSKPVEIEDEIRSSEEVDASTDDDLPQKKKRKPNKQKSEIAVVIPETVERKEETGEKKGQQTDKASEDESEIRKESVSGETFVLLPEVAQPELSIHDYANAIGRGLVTGRTNKQVGYQSWTYRKAQSAIRFLRRGATLDQAIAWSGSKRSVIEQLIKWGL